MATPPPPEDQKKGAAPVRARKQQRRRQVSLLLKNGYTDSGEIARQLGVPRAQVQKDILHLEAAWRLDQLRNMREHRARLLVLNDEIRQKALRAWERSLEDVEESSQSEENIELVADEGFDLPATRVRKTRKVRGQSGNAAYLRVLQECNTFEANVRGILPNRDKIDELKPEESTNRIDVKKLSPQELLIIGKLILQEDGVDLQGDAIDVEFTEGDEADGDPSDTGKVPRRDAAPPPQADS